MTGFSRKAGPERIQSGEVILTALRISIVAAGPMAG
jgi:hypothetical protein